MKIILYYFGWIVEEPLCLSFSPSLLLNSHKITSHEKEKNEDKNYEYRKNLELHKDF